MVAQSLIDSGGDIALFQRSLGRRFRYWLLGLPAGIGLATLRSILRLWMGISPQRSGVFSAGNGPAMRAAVLGAAVDDLPTLRELVGASSRITHSDPKAEYGAFAVALAAHMARHHAVVSGDQYLNELRSALGSAGEELTALLAKSVHSASTGESTESFADSLGLHRGVSGYVYHTVTVAIQAWLANPHDYRSAVTSMIRCGGDTDSTAAIVGGIVGAAVGKEGIPAEWLDTMADWPRTVSWMERLGNQLDASIQAHSQDRAVKLPLWGVLPRNLCFLLVVLFHGFRRLLPPY